MDYSPEPAPEILERFSKIRMKVMRQFWRDMKGWAKTWKEDVKDSGNIADELILLECFCEYIIPQMEFIEMLEKTYKLPPREDIESQKMPKYVAEFIECYIPTMIST